MLIMHIVKIEPEDHTAHNITECESDNEKYQDIKLSCITLKTDFYVRMYS